MVSFKFVASFLAAGVALAMPSSNERRAEWPYGPHKTSGRWIVTSDGRNINYAGTNWPGHADVMIPEGLQYQSVQTIVSRIKSLSMNAVRLTYAIQMIDEIYANGGKDITIQKAFTQALGATNGPKVLAQVLAKNPTFTAQTTRLQVFDAVAAELARQQIYIVLDNHISRGTWCCGGDDGNTWWGDRDFNLANWNRGLAYMAEHGKNWPALVAMSLRNEPREPPANSPARSTYNWRDWYGFVKQGANAVNKANPYPLIILSGLSYDTYITPVVQGTALTPGTGRFNRGDFVGYGDKLVLEIHNYENSIGSCSSLQSNLYRNGFEALSANAVNKFPILLTEYGFAMDANTWKGVYATCLASYLPQQKAGFFIWVLAGNYYIRSGTQDYDEAWGLMNHDWSNWRNPTYINQALIPQVKAVLA